MSKLHRRAVLTGSALSARVSQWTQRGVLKSLQAGAIDMNNVLTNTATLSPTVDPNNALLIKVGQSTVTSTIDGEASSRVAFTSGTTITAVVNVALPSASPTHFYVIEFVPGIVKSIQRNVIVLNGVAANTSAVNPVDVTKSALFSLGYNYATGANDDWTFHPTLVLTSATVVTASCGQATSFAVTPGFQLAEFY